MEIDFAYQLRFYLGLFERELVPWYRRLCLPGSRSFDVGAREGYVTLLLARLSSPGGRAVAFEFDATEYHRLLRNVAANPHLRPPPEASLSRVTERSDGAATVRHGPTVADPLAPGSAARPQGHLLRPRRRCRPSTPP